MGLISRSFSPRLTRVERARAPRTRCGRTPARVWEYPEQHTDDKIVDAPAPRDCTLYVAAGRPRNFYHWFWVIALVALVIFA